MSDNWISASEPPPNIQVIALCGDHQIMAFYAPPLTVVDSPYSDLDCDYDEETGEHYVPAGWYEIIRNWPEYDFVAANDPVTHWRPLPEPPE